MKSKEWTKEEEEILQQHYPKLKSKRRPNEVIWQELLAKLPGRSKFSCQVRASRLKASVKARWSSKEDMILQGIFSDTSARTIMAQLPGRSWEAILTRAKNLGLGDARWQGYLSMKATADRLGFSEQGMMRILEDMNVSLRIKAIDNKKGAKYQHKMIEWDTAVEAATEWLARETPRMAAKRMGLSGNLVARWVGQAGYTSPKRGRAVRLRPEVINEVVESRLKTWKPRPRKNKRIANG